MTKILKNFNLFVDGRGYAGRVDEVTPPKLTIKTEEFRAGGMDAPIEIDMGMEKIELGFTLAEFDPDVLVQFGIVTGQGVQITLRSALADNSSTTPMIIKAQGKYKEIDFGNFKAGDKGSMKCNVSCDYYSLQIGEKTIVEIDVNNMTRVIDGVDQMSETRDALGI